MELKKVMPLEDMRIDWNYAFGLTGRSGMEGYTGNMTDASLEKLRKDYPPLADALLEKLASAKGG